MLAVTMALLIGTAAAPALPVPHLDLETYRLDNGLQVILHRDPADPDAAVSLWYAAGSGSEAPGRNGLAHLCEHLMFQGSAAYDQDYYVALQDVGGAANARTNRDRTGYWETVPAAYLERALWLEAARMGGLAPALTQAKLDAQRAVIANELAQRAGEPYAGVDDRLLQLLYPEGHRYARGVGGSPEDLQALGLAEVRAFLASCYVPANATLCVAGDFEVAEVREWIQRFFGPIPGGEAVSAAAEETLPQAAGPRATIHAGDVSPQVVMGWHTPGWYRPGDAEFDLLADILGGGRSAVLTRALVRERRLAQEVQVRQDSRLLGGVFSIRATAAAGVDPQKLESAMTEELERVLAEGLDPQDVAVAVTRRHAGFLRRLEVLGGRRGLAELLNGYALHTGDPDYLQRDLVRYLEATPAGIRDWARRCLGHGSGAVLVVLPGSGPEEAVLAEPDRAGAPPRPAPADPPVAPTPAPLPDMGALPGPGRPHDFRPPPVESALLPSGLRIYVVRRAALPLVEAHLSILGGWSADPADRPGAASLTAAMLDEGAAGRGAMAVAEAVAAMGADLRTTANFDAVTISLNMLSPVLDDGLGLMADLAVRPDFPPEEFERLKARYRTRQQKENDDPDTRAIIELQRRLFGPDHPYRQPFTGSGTPASLAELAVTDLVAFHDRWYRPGNAVMVLVGDVTLAEATAAVGRAFGDWPDQEVPPLRPAERGRPAGPSLVVIDRPQAQQTHIVGGLAVPARGHPDYLPLKVANGVLGGQYSSRVNLKLREQMGVTYGARTRLIGFRRSSLFLATAPVATERAAEALTAFSGELEALRGARPVTAEELAAVRRRLAQAFARDFRTLAVTARRLDHLLGNGIDPTGWGDPVGQTENLGDRDLQRVIGRDLDPDRMIWVLVGPFDKLKKQLMDAGWGEAEVLD